MKTVVDIEPEILDWVIQNASVHIDSELLLKFEQWQTGKDQPTFNQIEKVSQATNIPLGYFFLKEPPAEDYSFLEYRTINSHELQNPSRNLLDTIQNMENIQEWMHNYLIKSGANRLDFVGSQKNVTNHERIADIIRKDFDLELEWYSENKTSWDSFKFLRFKCEKLGITVMVNGIVRSNTRRKLNINEFRAFTIIDDYAPLIFINSNDSANGLLFSLLHEIVHIWLGEDSLFNGTDFFVNNINTTETICNAAASEILVPQEIFIQRWNDCKFKSNIYERIDSLSFYFRCGTTVIARKAFTNKFISKKEYDEVASKAERHFYEMQEKNEGKSGGDYYKTMASRIDNRFLLFLAESAHNGTTTYTEALRLTNTNHQTFTSLVNKVRGVAGES